MLSSGLRFLARTSANRSINIVRYSLPATQVALPTGALRNMSTYSDDLTKDTPVWVEAYGGYVPFSDLATLEHDRHGNLYRMSLFDPTVLEDLRYELESRGIRVLQQAQEAFEETYSVFLRDSAVSWKKRGKYRRQWEINQS